VDQKSKPKDAGYESLKRHHIWVISSHYLSTHYVY